MEVQNVWVHSGPPANEDFFPDGPHVDLRDVGRVFVGVTPPPHNDFVQVFVGKVDDPEQSLVIAYIMVETDDPLVLLALLEDAYWCFLHECDWSQPRGQQTD